MADHHSPSPSSVSRLTAGFLSNLRFDVPAGFLVFLIAMPLCLGIATASNYPPIAGIWTAVIGGLLTCFLSNSQLTIKGPAAGLIVIAEGAVLELGAEFAPPGADLATQIAVGYKLALGVGVIAGMVQVLFGLLKVGKIGEMVPLTPVHGMLAAIGITIMAKQLFTMLGLSAPPGAPIESILAVPKAIASMKPAITTIGLISLAIMIAYPAVKARVPALKPIPAQLVVLAVGIPMGVILSVEGLGSADGNPMKFLVNVPDLIPDVLDRPEIAFAFPNFAGAVSATGVKYVLLFALIGSIESMLSSQAIDMIDPWRRKTDQNRDLLAVGLANMLCSAVGALPIISEIVRSKANIDNGARTKYANMFHGLFLLAFVLLLPLVIRMIPTTALAAMLVFTGFRLASPKEFVHAWRVGPEQLVVFVTNVVVTLCTDLLIGVMSGIALKVIIHLSNGAPIGSLFRHDIQVANTEDDRVAVLRIRRAAVFSNWLGMKAVILKQAEGRDEVVLDLSEVRLIDHSTMEKLHQMEHELNGRGKRLTLAGMEKHTPLSSHPLAARKSGL